MTWGPSRGIAVGGISFGVVVLVIGLLLLLVNQKVIVIPTFDIWTVCAIGLIVIGVGAIGGALWARRFVGRGWREWTDWGKGKDWQKEKEQ
ncbi:MAG TPA: hypothetical protein VIL58_02665 [Thermoplasmata archaeon]